jgi:hypothetical protein
VSRATRPVVEGNAALAETELAVETGVACGWASRVLGDILETVSRGRNNRLSLDVLVEQVRLGSGPGLRALKL